ncbi:hypothetical protein [Nostoc sp. FACHB-888]|uniref:hypothetical protein n=1 Tax=Nostoc sp. FACHB-888 TaxID=2692842 RepID=UPI001682EDB3|nr:hypothetical protein [Nostoc sp. FACHB-888]MBD2245231.1 hypothetical protein [Nostoc sp. FACHB-888]MCC5649912.1 hypothetical protein [Nostoc sp. XA013]
MTKQKSPNNQQDQTLHSSAEALEASQAREAGSQFEWHTGRIIRLGHFEIAGGRQVTIIWDEGGVMSQQGEITDEQWEIFKLAFMTTGRLAVLSDQEGEKWMRDYRFLEVIR